MVSQQKIKGKALRMQPPRMKQVGSTAPHLFIVPCSRKTSNQERDASKCSPAVKEIDNSAIPPWC